MPQGGGCHAAASAEAAASASWKVAGEEEEEEGPWYASMRSTKVARRPRPAEKEERPRKGRRRPEKENQSSALREAEERSLELVDDDGEVSEYVVEGA